MGFVPPFGALGRAACIVLLAVPAAAQQPPRLALPELDLPRLDPSQLDPSRYGAAGPVASMPRAAPTTRGLAACPEMSPGFVRLPGSRTCLRLSGRVAADLDMRAGRDGAAARPDATGRFAIDARTETDLGPVRTYLRTGSGHR